MNVMTDSKDVFHILCDSYILVINYYVQACASWRHVKEMVDLTVWETVSNQTDCTRIIYLKHSFSLANID